ncbi:MAG: chromate transporter [Candidatus Rokubacteria bacterium]|nr:chromate transporter [Candidatus Rokubacteria bacterium]
MNDHPVTVRANTGPGSPRETSPGRGRSLLEVLGASARLGLTSFGGPIAHLGYFREEYVVRRRWIDEAHYADLVALCQFLPGPASSQVGMALGIMRAGLLGGVVAWLGFTIPSAVALVAFAYGLQAVGVAHTGWLHGLKVVAVAVVAQAVWGMARSSDQGRFCHVRRAPSRPAATPHTVHDAYAQSGPDHSPGARRARSSTSLTLPARPAGVTGFSARARCSSWVSGLVSIAP